MPSGMVDLGAEQLADLWNGVFAGRVEAGRDSELEVIQGFDGVGPFVFPPQSVTGIGDVGPSLLPWSL